MPDTKTLLLVGDIPDTLIHFFKKKSFHTMVKQSALSIDFFSRHNIGFIISYRYRHMIQKEVIDLFPGRIINLHISLLPWNRGADPNLWSFLEDSPKGVTIHCVDPGLDTGDILVQKEYVFKGGTLSSTYDQLNQGIVQLLMASWDNIYNGSIPPAPQKRGTGSFHTSKDKNHFLYLIAEKGWETPVDQIRGKALNR